MAKSNTKVLKAGIGYTLGNYLIKGLSFFTLPIFARLLSTEDFGIYSTFLAYESILFIIVGVAIHSSYKNALYKYNIDDADNIEKSKLNYKDYVSATIWLQIFTACVFLIIGNVFFDYISSTLELDRFSVNMLVLYSFANSLLWCFNTDVSLEYDYKSYLKLALLNAVGNTVLSIILVLTIYSSQKYMGRIVGTVTPALLIAVYIIIKYLRKDSVKNIFAYLKWGVSFSFPVIFHGIGQVVLSQFDRIMIRKIDGDEAAGLYSFGYTFFSIINVTFNSLDSVWTTWFYEKMNDNDKTAIKKYSKYYVLLIMFLCSILMLVSPELVLLIGSKKYSESVYCTVPIIASGFFVFLYTLPASVEYYYEKTNMIALGTILASVINITLNMIFINRYGYIAAAYTTLFTYILYFLFHYYQSRKISKCNLFSNIVLVGTSFFIILIMAFSLCFIDFVWVRWIVAVVQFVIAVVYEEKKIKYINKFMKLLIKRRES